jgi:hypothetical protein
MASLTVPVKVSTLAANVAGIRAAPNRTLVRETANFRVNRIKPSLLLNQVCRCWLDVSI